MLNLNELGQGVSLNKLLNTNNTNINRNNLPCIPLKRDSFEINTSNKIIAFRQRGKEMLVVSFTGLNDPTEFSIPAIQMKVRGVSNHQTSKLPGIRPKDNNINKLADSDWYDGQEIEYKLKALTDGKKKKKKDKKEEKFVIELSAPGFGEIGQVHDEIAKDLIPLLKKKGDYRFELSNIIAGTSKGAETIGLRVNLIYQGNKKNEPYTREVFNKLLNSADCADKIMLYQSKTSIKDVLQTIFNNEETIKGPESVKMMKEVIQNIEDEIKNNNNRRILLVGHCKPDGDTIGCILGLKKSIALMDPSKQVDCAIDDKIPGLFRDKLPGINEVKYPYNPEREKGIQEEIKELKCLPQSKKTDEQIKALSEEIERMQNPDNLLDKNAKYDLVVLMDIPTPKRFTDKFKQYIENADKVIYIDHHPNRLAEWDNAVSETGVNMQKIIDDKLAWIAESVPSATELVAILAVKLVPALNSQKLASGKIKPEDIFREPGQVDDLNTFVANIVTGTSTDTGSFTRTANLLPEHMKMPVQERPNFLPEGLCKWLMGLTGNKINQKWIRENISYDISDVRVPEFEYSARDLMLSYAMGGCSVDNKLSLGIIQVDYDQMNNVLQAALKKEPKTTLLDVQNAFKYSEVMSTLNRDPEHVNKIDEKIFNSSRITNLHILAQEDYKGSYDKDRIAVLICQDKKAGELDEKMEFAQQNGLRLSFRSQNGSIHAELLASLFGGGGHGGAAGGRVDLPGVELDSKLAVTIDGKTENDISVIHTELKHNYDVNHSALSKDEKLALCKKIEVVKDQEGKTCEELIKDVVEEIRKKQPKEVPQEASKTSKKDNKAADALKSKKKKSKKLSC